VDLIARHSNAILEAELRGLGPQMAAVARTERRRQLA
jgi:hypothetical protein